MGKWYENYAQLEKRGILTAKDYSEMIRQFSKWATHLAVAQEDPLSTTRTQIFQRAQRLQDNLERGGFLGDLPGH